MEDVTEYKYLGTIMDSKMCFDKNAENVFRKANKRLFFLRKLRNLNTDKRIMELFYSSVIESILMFSIVCWHGNCTKRSKSKLDRIVNVARKLGLSNVKHVHKLYEKKVVLTANGIIKDSSHPLNCMYVRLRSDRRYRSIYARTSRYMNSFLPSSVRLLNSNWTPHITMWLKCVFTVLYSWFHCVFPLYCAWNKFHIWWLIKCYLSIYL